MKQFPLEHKIAVVTGCAGGIGAGIALGLAEAGADIVGVDLQDLEETAAQVRTLGRRFLAFRVDLSDREAVDAAWTQILAEAGGVDILVNNAGMQYRQNAYEYPLDVFDKVIAVNLRAGYQLAQLAAGHYRAEKKRGKIINLASLFSTFGGVNVSGYTCSKHGVVGMTRALSNEFAADGICVNAIAPGYIATELTKAIWSDPEKSRPMDERIPMGALGKTPGFRRTAVFLASEASDYVSGIVLPVDGGYSAR